MVHESGIYWIRNLLDGKVYIGSTSCFKDRWNEHRCSLLRNAHPNIHLQRAWNRDHEKNFTFTVLERVISERKLLIEREQYYLDLYSKEQKYNLRLKAENQLGIKHSNEVKEKISKSRKGKGLGNKGNLGRKLTTETKEKISRVITGQKRSEHTKELISKVNLNNQHGIGNKSRLGQKRSLEEREKQRQKNLGRKHSPETIEKIRQWNLKRSQGRI